MKSILLVLGTRRYRDALLGAAAAVRAGEHASLHVVVLSGTLRKLARPHPPARGE